MALTASPYAQRFTQSSLGVTPPSPSRYPIMSRNISVNMDGTMADYGTESEGIDPMDMVADFGEGMVNFGQTEDIKTPIGEGCLCASC